MIEPPETGEAPNSSAMLDLGQFQDLADALDQLSDSKVYEQEIAAAMAYQPPWTLVTIFAQSACTRMRAFHESALREISASNPHSAFTLNRAFAETVLTLAYAVNHPDYVERILRPKAEQPKGLKPLAMVDLKEHIKPDAPGFAAVYAELCEITHFGSLALWHPHRDTGRGTVEWMSAPRWSREIEPLVACAQLAELSHAGVSYLHNFLGAHVIHQPETVNDP